MCLKHLAQEDFSQHICGAAGDGTYGEAEKPGWVIAANFHERQQ